MASLFGNDPGKRPPLSAYAPERLEHETAHLRNRGTVRHGKEIRRSWTPWLIALAVGTLLWLFFMDPVLHSLKRSDAIRTYVYLHNYGSDAKAKQLAATGIFTPNEVGLLDQRAGSFQDYFANEAEAERSADGIIRYMQGLADLHAGKYENLDWLGKIRYQLFVRFGLIPPTKWDVFEPSVVPK